MPFLGRFKHHYQNQEPHNFPVIFGLLLITVFLITASISPQIGKKLGKLSSAKNLQSAYAAAGDLEERNRLVGLINVYRAENGLNPFEQDQILINAACWMAKDMADKQYENHIDSLGRTPHQRMRAFGLYEHEGSGENIAVYHFSAQAALDGWKNSPGHNAIMLSSNQTTRIGIGVAYNSNNILEIIWVLNVATTIYQPISPFTYLPSDCSIKLVTLSGRAINSQTQQGLANTTINQNNNPCGNLSQTATTDANGYFSFSVPIGTSFCLRAPPVAGYNGPDRSYECQTAGYFRSPDICGLTYDLQEDNNFNFNYNIPSPSGQITARPFECGIPNGVTSCTSEIQWQTSNVNSAFVCVDAGNNGSENSLLAQGLTGSQNIVLSGNQANSYVLRTHTQAVCGQGTILDTTIAVSHVIKGNADCDLDVDTVDALFILKKVANMQISGTNCAGGNINTTEADVDSDGDIDSVDALKALRYAGGTFNDLPDQTGGQRTPISDRDHDGITDSEESRYSCMNPNVADAAANPDNDGVRITSSIININISMDNASEIILGTNPCQADTDGDGYKDGAEVYVGTKPEKACISGPEDIDTTKPGNPSKTWPADLNTSPFSYNKINISDIASYTSEPRRYNSSPPNSNFDWRWDVVPGPGPIPGAWINVADLQSIAYGTAPMFNNQKMFSGPVCIQNQ